ncbi:unnamed protein product [Mycena citricolor]|uniref:Uncharacterized protein n=1 Tax=Mycena citricolor TaxID=2018698 RepID=A0AAD2H5D4_9AGAR|nr:unnamed protein product [Mycena citricolor]
MGDVPLDEIGLVSLIIETFLMGIFTTMFATVLRLIVTKAIPSQKTARLVLPTITLIWLLAVSHWILDISRAETAFMHQPNAAVFFANVSSPVEVAKVVLYVTATLIGDWFMIYRSYKIWQSSLPIVALPIVLWIGSIVSGYGGAYATHATKQGTELSPVVVWIPTFIALSLATNGYCTILIAYRILRSQFAVRKMNAVNSRMTSLVPEQVVFLESAALYSAELIALLVTHQLEVNVQYVVLDATCSLLGITFSMIILPVTGAKQGSELSGSGRPAAPRIEGVNVSRLVEVTTDNVHQMDSFDRVKVDASA